MGLYRTLCSAATKSRTFSGIQPTGTIHLGNYFGAVQQWVQNVQKVSEEDKNQQIFSVVDLHAITLPQDPKQLKNNILGMTASLIGCGLDPEKAIIFQQSHVPHHTQLCWLLGCLCTVPMLQRLSQYKDKSQGLKEIPLGLFTYPVLQAADILLYKATHVPVGEDNLQNVEIARKIARKFNSKFKQEVFPLPSPVLVTEESSRRIRSLRNPENNMSKSDSDPKSCVYILDHPDEIRLKIKRAVTDTISAVTFDPVQRPGVSNLVCIHSRITGKDTETICAEAQGLDTGQYKLVLADVVVEHFAPIRSQTNYLMEHKDHLEAVLKKGADRAKAIADETLQQSYSAVGLRS